MSCSRPCLVLAFWLLASAAVIAQSGEEPSAAELLERTARAYAQLRSYSDILVLRESVVSADGTEKELSTRRCAVVAARQPARVAMRPGAGGWAREGQPGAAADAGVPEDGAIVADGRNLVVHEPAGNRFAVPAQRTDLWGQLQEIPLAQPLWYSLPAHFLLAADPVGSLVASYGEMKVGTGGPDRETLVVELPASLFTIDLDRDTAMVLRWRIFEPLPAPAGDPQAESVRVLECSFLERRLDPTLPAATWEPKLPEGAVQVEMAELVAGAARARSLVGAALPDFDAPAVAPGAAALSRERLAGRRWLVSFLSTADPEARAHLDDLAGLTAGGAAVSVAVVATDEDAAAAMAFLRRHALPGFLDPGGVIAESLGLGDPLTTLVIDEQGMVLAEVHGAPGGADLREILARAQAVAAPAAGGGEEKRK